MRATPPSLRMSAGTRSRAITATAPASSAIRACSAVVTSMITPPFSISARPVFRGSVPVLSGSVMAHASSRHVVPGRARGARPRRPGARRSSRRVRWLLMQTRMAKRPPQHGPRGHGHATLLQLHEHGAIQRIQVLPRRPFPDSGSKRCSGGRGPGAPARRAPVTSSARWTRLVHVLTDEPPQPVRARGLQAHPDLERLEARGRAGGLGRRSARCRLAGPPGRGAV